MSKTVGRSAPANAVGRRDGVTTRRRRDDKTRLVVVVDGNHVALGQAGKLAESVFKPVWKVARLPGETQDNARPRRRPRCRHSHSLGIGNV